MIAMDAFTLDLALLDDGLLDLDLVAALDVSQLTVDSIGSISAPQVEYGDSTSTSDMTQQLKRPRKLPRVEILTLKTQVETLESQLKALKRRLGKDVEEELAKLQQSLAVNYKLRAAIARQHQASHAVERAVQEQSSWCLHVRLYARVGD